MNVRAVGSVQARRLAGALGALALTLGWLAAPASPPLYDGIGFPDEPYRYAGTPPAGAAVTPPPTAGHTTVPAVAGSNSDQTYVTSDEQAPQVTLFVAQRLLLAGARATRIEVSLTPAAPDGPADGAAVFGNVYRLTATADDGSVQVGQPPDSAVVSLRAPSAPPPSAVLAYRTEGGRWQRLPTALVGTEIYQARVAGLGDYALVVTAQPGQSRSTGGSLPLLLGLGLLVLAMAAVLLLVRRSARRPA
ncbi:MAG: hypothetical protein M3Z02_09150 [Actinomycetota bacterium]|nr:hypothetical protein [Actinomycetota bacterium]